MLSQMNYTHTHTLHIPNTHIYIIDYTYAELCCSYTSFATSHLSQSHWFSVMNRFQNSRSQQTMDNKVLRGHFPVSFRTVFKINLTFNRINLLEIQILWLIRMENSHTHTDPHRHVLKMVSIEIRIDIISSNFIYIDTFP